MVITKTNTYNLKQVNEFIMYIFIILYTICLAFFYKLICSKISLIMSRYEAGGISIDELRMLPPKDVEELFYPPKNLQRKDIPLPDFQYYYDRIHANKSKVNIAFCWLEYKEKNPNGYEKSQFYEYYNRFVAENYGSAGISMAVNRVPGEKMYIDWVS